ncbi:hypothetical protein BDF20DRAFT_832826 [Mycotypha africana]|uniref:uncharacterized protein n=1 Tax=Mycotypha africana TaxID=64632 RepID=UPI0022FFC917|nr:uncharacterized protein BDF20DRAFT_832826 [Mycotypha africana]KAI8987939.1 hypothetical protein BDF20DRAFT_832826 [Mycotypha africana]
MSTITPTIATNCTLPPIADILIANSNKEHNQRSRSTSVLDIANLLTDSPSLVHTPSSPVSTIASTSSIDTEHYNNINTPVFKQTVTVAAITPLPDCYTNEQQNKNSCYSSYFSHHQQHHHFHSDESDNKYIYLKAKRKRASANQLMVLNSIFSQTYFPSTEIRIELGKKLGMSPRTVQIWFQNKRQALRARGRQQQQRHSQFQMPGVLTTAGNHNYHPNPRCYRKYRPFVKAVAQDEENNDKAYCNLPPLLSPPRSPTSLSEQHRTPKYSLPPLNMPLSTAEQRFPSSPNSCSSHPTFNSSIDFLSFP